MTYPLGYAIDHPLAVASQTSDKHWPMTLLMRDVPPVAAPAHYVHPDLSPTALDQTAPNPYGEGNGTCVAAAGETIKQAQEHADWGQWLFSTDSQFTAYHWLKRGTPDGSFPGDGIPNVEGSYPEALWKMALAYGLPAASGQLHKISAYYSHPFGGPADLDFLKQVILAYGPVNFAIPWPGNWFGAPPAPDYRFTGIYPSAGGHSITVGGWDDEADGTWLVAVQTWGTHWTNEQGIYRFRAEWLYTQPLGPQLMWKTVDIKDAPAPPPPTPEGPMLTVVDRVGRLVDSAVGKPIYALDGTTVLSPLKSGELGLASPALLSGGYYAILASVNGVLQLAALKAADCTNVRVLADPSAAVAAEHKLWTDWLASAPKS